MDPQPRRPRLTLAIAPAAACAAGSLVALTLIALPSALLEGVVSDSGLPAVLAAAAPPLGFTARVALAAVFGGGTALVGWLALFLMLGTRSVTLGERAARIVRRRADAHPDAPPRRPLFAGQELGVPFLDIHASAERMLKPPVAQPRPIVEQPAPVADTAPEPERPAPVAPLVERALPADLDQPLAAFHPAAMPRPAEPPRAPRPAAPAGTIDDLLARLERGIVRPAVPPQPNPHVERGLGDALASLRHLAATGR